MDTYLHDGIYAAALIPLDANLNCDAQELSRHCIDLMQRGCKGVVLFGTTGEGPSFSTGEKVAALKEVIAGGVNPKKIIMASGSGNIPETTELLEASLQLQVSSFLISPPAYFKDVTERGVIAFYREIFQRVANPKLRILLYHIPQFTGVPMTLEIIKALRSEFPEIVVGIKESEGNLDFTKAIIKAIPGFKVYVGKEKDLIEAVRCGAAGGIGGVANLYPELICSLCEKGKQLSKELETFFVALKGYPFLSAFKAILEEKKRGCMAFCAAALGSFG